MAFFGLFRRRAKPRPIDPHAAHEAVSAGALALIDVRQPEEWAEGRPAGARGAPLRDADFLDRAARAVGGDASRPLATSCITGARAGEGAKRLIAAGFADISFVVGGFRAWREAGLPVDEPPFDD
ncbi:MAG: rhodanese-like domain-containing protein [Parvularculaceae bacterium]